MNIVKQRLLIFLTDAAGENKSCFKTLQKEGFTKTIHVTCLAHGLNNVIQLLPDEYLKANKLIVLLKDIYVRAPKRRLKWKKINPKINLPPKFVTTRWCSWLRSALYFTEEVNIQAVKRAMNDLIENDKGAKKKAKKILKLIDDRVVKREIALLKSEYMGLIYVTRILERNTTTLADTVRIVEKLKNNLLAQPNVPKRIKTKLKKVLKKNKGYGTIRKLVLENKIESNLVNMSDEERKLSLNAPGASSDVERSFSIYKLMMRSIRNRFEIPAFRLHFIPKMAMRRSRKKVIIY